MSKYVTTHTQAFSKYKLAVARTHPILSHRWFATFSGTADPLEQGLHGRLPTHHHHETKLRVASVVTPYSFDGRYKCLERTGCLCLQVDITVILAGWRGRCLWCRCQQWTHGASARPPLKCEDNIEVNLTQIRWEVVDSIGVTQYREYWLLSL